DDLLAVLEPQGRQIDADLREIQTAQGQLRTGASQVENATFQTRAYLRSVEMDQDVPVRLQGISGLGGLAQTIDDAARTLTEKALPGAVCKASYTAADAALARKLNGFAQDNRVAQELEFDKNLRRLENDDTTRDNCPDADRAALARLRAWLAANRPDVTTTETGTLREIKGIIEDHLDQLVRLDQIAALSADLLSKAPNAAKTAQGLAVLRQREIDAISTADNRATLPVRLCSLSMGVLPVFKGDPRVRALKFQKRKFSLKASAPLAADLEKRHKELDAVEYELDSKLFNDFSFGFGVIRTDLANPVWKATAHPTLSDKKVIRRTDEETRTGEAALILSFVPGQPERFLRWGVDVGAALDTANPTALAGVSLSLGRFVRLGYGRAWTRVKRLDDDQSEFSLLADGTVDPASVVSSGDDIRTRNDFKDDEYFSLTFTLDALPFFRPAS
ncbi:MAG: hypothetical protein ACLGI9_22765, partial [Thermoanaerobaculia bacterium]